MSRIALTLAYDGAGSCGWQTQPDGTALQDVLERALSEVAATRIETVCAGRTDAGVHASCQVVHFDSEVTRPLQAWVRGTNANLPDAIAVQSAHHMPGSFHARFSAQRRAYDYVIHRANVRHPLLHARTGWVFQPLDVTAMSAAAHHLIGQHDFSALRSSQCQAATPVRTIETLALRESGSLLVLTVIANAFLHHMVRNLVGALVWVGMGRRPPHWIAELLAGRDRTQGPPTFAAAGLYLSGVDYGADSQLPSWPPQPPALLHTSAQGIT